MLKSKMKNGILPIEVKSNLSLNLVSCRIMFVGLQRLRVVMLCQKLVSLLMENVLLSSSILYLSSSNTVDAKQLQKITLLAFSTYLAIE